jgi:Putative heavy-metal chelation
LGNQRIVDIVFKCHKTLVELNDGSIGFAMNYGRIPASVGRLLRRQFLERTEQDPCLLNLLFNGEQRPVCRARVDVELGGVFASLRVAIVSSLSSKYLREDDDPVFIGTPDQPHGLFRGFSRAIVIGFGGLLERILHESEVRDVTMVDLTFNTRPDYFKYLLERYRSTHLDKNIVVTSLDATNPRRNDSEVVAITGSALVNGSMEHLLTFFDGSYIIVNGGSASIYPEALFRRGVRVVGTALRYRRTDHESNTTKKPSRAEVWRWLTAR